MAGETERGNAVRWFILPDGRLPKPLEMYRRAASREVGQIKSLVLDEDLSIGVTDEPWFMNAIIQQWDV